MFQALGLAAVCVGLGGPVTIDPPADREVLRAVPKAKSVPYVYEAFRDDVVIVKNQLAMKEAKLNVFGIQATVVRTQWECPVYYTETVKAGVLFPVQVTKNRVQVVYINTVNVVK